jgi:hypothetical protein
VWAVAPVYPTTESDRAKAIAAIAKLLVRGTYERLEHLGARMSILGRHCQAVNRSSGLSTITRSSPRSRRTRDLASRGETTADPAGRSQPVG